LFRILSIISLGGLVWVLTDIDPEKAGAGGKFIFYGVLFFFLVSVFNLLFIYFRKSMLHPEMAAQALRVSFRQAILLSLLAGALLGMQSFRVLVWWDGLLVVAGISLIELYFLSRH